MADVVRVTNILLWSKLLTVCRMLSIVLRRHSCHLLQSLLSNFIYMRGCWKDISLINFSRCDQIELRWEKLIGCAENFLASPINPFKKYLKPFLVDHSQLCRIVTCINQKGFVEELWIILILMPSPILRDLYFILYLLYHQNIQNISMKEPNSRALIMSIQYRFTLITKNY